VWIAKGFSGNFSGSSPKSHSEETSSMIIYELICEEGHCFEGWFQDHEIFQDQLERNLITCPTCGSLRVTQRLSTGGTVGRRQDEAAHSEGDPASKEYQASIQALRAFVETRFEDVGAEFAKTALKMHYGAEEKRDIRGIATEAEEETLKQEGVKFFKVALPTPPDDPELN
jgi:hypothetical protein